MNKLFIIFKHEFKQITKGKVFIIMTLLGPLLFGALTIIPSYFAIKSSEPEEDAIIAVYGREDEVVKRLEELLIKEKLKVIRVYSEEEGKQLVIDETSKGFTIIPSNIVSAEFLDYYSSTGTDFQYSNIVQKALREYIYSLKKNELGLSTKESKWLSDKIILNSKKLSDNGDVDDSSYESVLIIGMVFSILIMMTVLIYGMSAAKSVLAEKTTKTIEILLSTVKPFKILLGKVLGAGLAGLLQFSVWMIMALIIAKFVIPYMNISIPQDIFSTQNIFSISIFFLLGFFFYIFIYAAVGANVENEQNLGQVQIPLQLFLMMPMMISTAIISNPNGALAKFLSYFPFTSSSVMSIRVLIDSPGTPMVLVSMGILLLSLGLVLFGSAKLFKIGLLTKGKKINFIQLVKRLFQK